MLPLRTQNHRRTARIPGRWIPGTVGTAAAVGVLTHGVLPRILGKWGAAGAEVGMPLPGDHLIPEPGSVQTMAVTIAAPPVENGLLHLGVTNADRIHPEWQDLAVGDTIAFTPARYPGGRMGPRVVELERGRHLVLDASPGAPAGTVTGTWQFILRDADDGGTRLLLRTRSGPGRPAALRFLDFLLQPAYLVMDRAMLLGIKERAERQTQKKEQATAGSALT